MATIRCVDPDPLVAAAAEVLELLVARGETLATAESLTGGMLAAAVTAVPGASRCFRGGAVTYATELKTGLLGVPESVVRTEGVISAACAEAMAEGARRLAGASYAVSTTGVAGPDLQEGRPAGTVFVGLSGPSGTTSRELRLPGDRDSVRRAACADALDALSAVLRREEPGLG